MFSIAVRSRMSAASERSARCRCSVTSTAMPISWISGASGSITWARARTHTHCPLAWRMRKTWSIWSISRATIRLASSNRSPSSWWMICGDLAEGQHRVAGLVAEHVVHRARPVHLAAHHVPVPQAAAAAHQREVDALVRFEVDAVGRLRPRRLAEIGVEDDEQHAAVTTNSVTFIDTVRRHSAKTVSWGIIATAAPDRLSVRSTAAYQLRSPILTSMTPARSPNMKSGWPPETMASRLCALPAGRAGRGGDDLERAVGDDEHVAPASIPLCDRLLDQALRLGFGVVASGLGEHQRIDELAGGEPQHRLRVALDVVAQRHQRQEAHRGDDDQEDQDQDGDRALQQRLGSKQTTIGRRSDDARIPSDICPPLIVAGKSRAFGRAPRVRSGHADPPKHSC